MTLAEVIAELDGLNRMFQIMKEHGINSPVLAGEIRKEIRYRIVRVADIVGVELPKHIRMAG